MPSVFVYHIMFANVGRYDPNRAAEDGCAREGHGNVHIVPCIFQQREKAVVSMVMSILDVLAFRRADQLAPDWR